MAKEDAVVYTFREPVRAGFCNIIAARKFEPKPGRPAGDPRFDATFILKPDSPDLLALKDLVVTMAKSLYPGKKLVTRRLTQEEVDDAGVVEITVPWSNGTRAADKAKENGKDMEFARDQFLLKASSKYAPALSAVENGKIVEYADPETRPTLTKLFYSGAFLVPYVQLHSYKSMGDDGKPGGVGLWLSAVCFVKHGPRLAGGNRANVAEVFASYAGKVSGADPTAGDMDDEIPF